MEGVLIKENSGYSLSVDNKIFASTDGHPLKAIGNKLSLTNCEAIACGYDLEELFNDVDESIDYHEFDFTSFRLGFQKALELMCDNKFSEEDMSKAWSEGYHRKVDELNGNGLRYFDKFIQSLQQTEWDVEIEEKEVCGWDLHADPPEKIFSHLEPKLDSQGCLILKRKQ